MRAGRTWIGYVWCSCHLPTVRPRRDTRPRSVWDPRVSDSPFYRPSNRSLPPPPSATRAARLAWLPCPPPLPAYSPLLPTPRARKRQALHCKTRAGGGGHLPTKQAKGGRGKAKRMRLSTPIPRRFPSTTALPPQLPPPLLLPRPSYRLAAVLAPGSAARRGGLPPPPPSVASAMRRCSRRRRAAPPPAAAAGGGGEVAAPDSQVKVMLCWLLYSTYPVLGICASPARPSRCLVHFDFSLPSSGLFKFVPLVRRIDRLNSLWTCSTGVWSEAGGWRCVSVC